MNYGNISSVYTLMIIINCFLITINKKGKYNPIVMAYGYMMVSFVIFGIGLIIRTVDGSEDIFSLMMFAMNLILTLTIGLLNIFVHGRR